MGCTTPRLCVGKCTDAPRDEQPSTGYPPRVSHGAFPMNIADSRLFSPKGAGNAGQGGA
jgi:hypothetical protein